MAPSPRSSHRQAWAWLAVALLAVLPYVNGLGGDFVFDDVLFIRDNPAVQRQPALQLFASLIQPGSLYRPLTMLTYAGNARIERGPLGFHLVNLALHLLVSLGVYALARLLLGTGLAALAAATLFAVHPIHTEAVTGIVGRAELLAALAALVTLLAFRRACEASGRWRTAWLATSLSACALGLLAKETAFTVIGLVAVLHWWVAPRATWRQRVLTLAPYLLLGAAYLALRLAVAGALALPEAPDPLDNPLGGVDAVTRVRTALVILWDYLALLLLPLRLSADYSFNQIPLAQSWGEPRVVGIAALMATAAVALFAVRRRAPVLVVAAACLAIPLALTANLFFPIGTIKAERLLYLPSLGWCLLAGWLLGAMAERHRRTAGAVLVILLALGAARTWARNCDWRDEMTLYAATAAVAPGSAKAQHNFAVALQRAGRFDEALARYHRALVIYPAYASAAFGIGHIFALRGDDDAALEWLQAAVRLDWRLATAHLQLGLLRARHRQPAAAEAAFAAGLESDPANAMLLVNLAAARLAQGDRWGAAIALDRLERAAPPGDPQIAALVAQARREIEVALR